MVQVQARTDRGLNVKRLAEASLKSDYHSVYWNLPAESSQIRPYTARSTRLELIIRAAPRPPSQSSKMVLASVHGGGPSCTEL